MSPEWEGAQRTKKQVMPAEGADAGYIVCVSPTTGQRERYKLNPDGTFVIPFPPAPAITDFHRQLMEALHTFSTAEGDILAAAATLEERLRLAKADARAWHTVVEDLHAQIDDSGVKDSASGSIHDKVNAVFKERDRLREQVENQAGIIRNFGTPANVREERMLMELGALRDSSPLRWAAHKALRQALFETITHLQTRLETVTFGSRVGDPCGSKHLTWMCEKLISDLDVMPIDKTSRWIGFIQGVMAANGQLDVDQERDRTRPFFQKAYQLFAAAAVAQAPREGT